MDDSVNDEVFTEGLQSPQCVKILIKCLRNLESKVEELHSISNATKENQIKGDGYLANFKKSVEFISTQFEVYEKERKEKEEAINLLKVEVASVKKKNEDLEKRIDDQDKRLDDQEQYTRRNCLLLHGVKGEKNEDTDQLAVDIINKDVDVEISEKDLDRSHRLGKPRAPGGKPRPIIIKFSRYNVRHLVFKSKKKLKEKGVAITESLTKRRMEALTKAKEEHGFNNVWSIDGMIFFKQPGADPKVYDF